MPAGPAQHWPVGVDRRHRRKSTSTRPRPGRRRKVAAAHRRGSSTPASRRRSRPCRGARPATPASAAAGARPTALDDDAMQRYDRRLAQRTSSTTTRRSSAGQLPRHARLGHRRRLGNNAMGVAGVSSRPRSCRAAGLPERRGPPATSRPLRLGRPARRPRGLRHPRRARLRPGAAATPSPAPEHAVRPGGRQQQRRRRGAHAVQRQPRELVCVGPPTTSDNACVLLELRRHDVQLAAPGVNILSTATRWRLRLREWHLDGHAARGRRGGAAGPAKPIASVGSCAALLDSTDAKPAPSSLP